LTLIKFKQNIKHGISKKGIESGLDPQVTEMIEKLLIEANQTGKIIVPRHLQEKDKSLKDSGLRKGFFYAIYKADGYHKGFAKRNIGDKSIDIETSIRKSLFETGKELFEKIDLAEKGYKAMRVI